MNEIKEKIINYYIEGSDPSPSAIMDGCTGTIDISGILSVKSPTRFYNNISRWILTFNRNYGKTIEVNIRLIHLTTSSAKWLKDALEYLEKYSNKSIKPEINWY